MSWPVKLIRSAIIHQALVNLECSWVDKRTGILQYVLAHESLNDFTVIDWGDRESVINDAFEGWNGYSGNPYFPVYGCNNDWSCINAERKLSSLLNHTVKYFSSMYEMELLKTYGNNLGLVSSDCLKSVLTCLPKHAKLIEINSQEDIPTQILQFCADDKRLGEIQ